MQIHFYKYQGTGNDFIILDNRSGEYGWLNNEQIRSMCDRRFGIGADGLMLLETASEFDFRMKYHNADGKEGSMCGNGGRCIVKFAFDQGIISGTSCRFIAIDGEHVATISNEGIVSLNMQDVQGIQDYQGGKILDTGSPHYVRFTDDVDQVDVFNEGIKIRYSNDFADQGINVNFVEQREDLLILRTYERGVEDETLSCGTGATATAIASSTEDGPQKHQVKVRGGLLQIAFNRENKNRFSDVWLTGPALFVYKGTM